MSAAEAHLSSRPHGDEGGDRVWEDAGRDTLSDLASLVRKRAKAIGREVGVDAVHDMRTATRRLRTAITLYGEQAPRKRRARVEDELKRVARRLGVVRDLDVLLETLGDAGPDSAHRAGDLRPVRDAWRAERSTGAKRLRREVGRRRFRRAVRVASRMADDRADASSARDPGADAETDRVATEAPGLIWQAFGNVLAYEVDPNIADPAVIHRMRIAAKKLRYTLEAFADALEPGASLIEDVTTLQDEAGSMHDAIVAGDRARSAVPARDLTGRQRRAIEAFADSQVRKADELRPAISRRLRRIRSRAFRESLGRAVAGMGHVTV